MKELLETQHIYESQELQQFIYNLETKYVIEKAQDHYKNLVNFSTNLDTPYHKWFPYREGFSSQLIKELIIISGTKPGESVVDPFCGSGTTNVVAALLGYDTLGLDINPMSAFITDAKVSTYSDCDIDDAVNFEKNISNNCFEKIDVQKDLEKYFEASILKDLTIIKSKIDQVKNVNTKKLLMVAFLSIIIDCSNRKRDGNGLKIRKTKIDNVYSSFSQKLNDIILDVKNHRIKDIHGHGRFESAINLRSVYTSELPNIPIGTIIFSPPYANSFDYFESYKLELILGGFTDSLKGLETFRKRAVRSFIGQSSIVDYDKIIDLIAKEIEMAIPIKEIETGKKDMRTRKVPNMIKGYFNDMKEVIVQCSDSLQKGKKTFIVVDQSSYLGKIIPTDLLFGYIAENSNFEVERIIECRKARTSPQQLNKYPYLKDTLRESIVELKKR